MTVATNGKGEVVAQKDEGREVAVVTGASKRIGRGIALYLADAGYDVAVLDPLASDIADVIAARGVGSCHLQVDVSSEADVVAAAEVVEQRLGCPQVLVNNAGIYPRGAALDMPYDEWLRTIHVNLGGPFLCARTFARGMFAVGGGRIINIASDRAFQGAVNGSNYAASKGGVVSLTRSLANEWAPVIRVDAIVPGLTDTDQPRGAGLTSEQVRARGKDVPMGRTGTRGRRRCNCVSCQSRCGLHHRPEYVRQRRRVDALTFTSANQRRKGVPWRRSSSRYSAVPAIRLCAFLCRQRGPTRAASLSCTSGTGST